MSDLDLWLENFWGALLSENPDLIRKVWAALDEETKTAVHAHLTRMAGEPGWSEVQRASAQVALQTLDQEGQH